VKFTAINKVKHNFAYGCCFFHDANFDSKVDRLSEREPSSAPVSVLRHASLLKLVSWCCEVETLDEEEQKVLFEFNDKGGFG